MGSARTGGRAAARFGLGPKIAAAAAAAAGLARGSCHGTSAAVAAGQQRTAAAAAAAAAKRVSTGEKGIAAVLSRKLYAAAVAVAVLQLLMVWSIPRVRLLLCRITAAVG